MKLKLEVTSQCFLSKKKTQTTVPPGREGSVKACRYPGCSHPHQPWVSCLGRSNAGRVLGVREETNIKTGPQCSGDAATEPVRFLVHLCFGASEVMTSLWPAPGR